MQEGITVYLASHDDEVVRLVDKMRRNPSVITIGTIGGASIAADPAVYARRPRYTVELQWTVGMAVQRPSLLAELQNGRLHYHNLVPPLEQLAAQLMRELNQLDTPDITATLTWLTRLAPICWHRETFSQTMLGHITARLERYAPYRPWKNPTRYSVPTCQLEVGIRHVLTALCCLNYHRLTPEWLAAAQQWLREYR